MEAEWGSTANLRRLKSEIGTMYDKDGNPILCKCGKPAGCAAIGKEAFVAWCSECSPLPKHEAKLVYRPPSEEQKKKLKDLGYNILEDAWIS